MKKRTAGGVGGTIGAAAYEAWEPNCQGAPCENEETTAAAETCPWKMKRHLCKRQH